MKLQEVDEILESGWCSAGIWEVPELMHRLAASFAPPGDVGDNVEGVLFVIERVLRVSGSLV